MPETGEQVVLTVEGARYSGWKQVRVQRSMAQVAGSFALELTNKYPGEPQRLKINDQSPCSVAIGGKTIITGFVSKLTPSYAPGSHSISVQGMDATADLARASIIGPPTQWMNQTLMQIAREICKPFGISVVAEAGLDIAKPFVDVRANEGDEALSLINKLCQARGVLPVSYGDGKLIFTTAEKARAGGSIQHPGNAKSGRADYDSCKRFSEYHVKGQGESTGPVGGFGNMTNEDRLEHQKSYIAPAGKATDPLVRRYLPKVILADADGDSATFAQRAAWEATVRAGQSRKVTYTVTGWEWAAGRIWEINTICQVTDALLGASGRWLVEGVTFVKDNSQGTITQLQLVHPDAYKPFAKPEAITAGYDALIASK
jgi:prophage tail gpP-like protein